MIASSQLDPMLGIDIHWEMVPMPAPVPTPIPNPFTGIVFDPIGLAAGLIISNAIGMALGGTFKGPVLYWTAFPASNTGTQGKHIPGHILIPPGTAWAPVPRTPRPVIHPGETPKPPKPITPEDDAVIVFGSKTVHVSGTNAVRLGDLAMSCSEPIRLPSSVVLAVPKGAPILIGGPPTLDLMAAVLASLRTRFISDSLHSLLSRMQPSRFRSFLQRAVCFFTGHPVDVATGKVMTDAVDAELPGPLPLRVERVYSSAFASRKGPLGHGWSLSLDQAVWRERGKVVYLAGDGREIEFDTFDLPDHQMKPGDEVWHPIDRLTLRCEGKGCWRITTHDGLRYEFAPLPYEPDGRARLQRIASRCGSHEILFTYDEGGRLDRVRDSGGRILALEHDEQDRVVALQLPNPDGRGASVHRRYRYDDAGDLVEVVDSDEKSWRFEYVTHLLVREMDRTGLSFYFAYDGLGEDAWCTRTWGDGGIYDHVLRYDKKNKVTYVTNSRGQTTQYHMNLVGLVTQVVDPCQGKTKYEYDPRTLQRTAEIDPLGNATRCEYDARGNCVKVTQPDGSAMTLEYDPSLDLPVRVLDARGGEWRQRYDGSGRLLEKRSPDGAVTLLEWERGLLSVTTGPNGRRSEVRYDGQKNAAEVSAPNGAVMRFAYDRRGRPIEIRDAGGGVTRARYDSEGRTLEIVTAARVRLEQQFDAEGNLIEARDANRHVRLRYAGFHKLAARSENGGEVRFERDTEGAITALINEVGERCEFELDACGRVVRETGFDGAMRRYVRDAAGRVKEIHRASRRVTALAYDAAGRVTKVQHGDGTGAMFEYAPDGAMLRAKNESADVRFERDVLGRAVREVAGEAQVLSKYGLSGGRDQMETSLGARAVALWDSMGALQSLHLGGAQAPAFDIGFARDAMGREVARSMPGGVKVTWRRDHAGRPIGRRARGVGAQAYRWRGEDQIAETVGTTLGVTTYLHDTRGRLVEEQRPGGATVRAMDPAGNVYRSADGRDRRYGPGGRIEEARGARYEHDTDGNLVAKHEPDGRVWRYAWNGAGLLREVERPDGTRVRFEYDAFARRTRKQLVRTGEDGQERIERDVRFVWDEHQVVHEIASDEGVTTWHWEPDSFTPVAKEQGGKRWSIASDHLGTPTAMYDELGKLAWQMQLDLYGVGRKDTQRQTCPWRWPGQYEDEETGLYYNRFRYYDPETGRYISKDPIGLEGGTALYAYVHDTTTTVDPFGLAPLDFATLMNMAQNTLDFSTPRDGAVFWSGNRMSDAQAWAAANGKTTLEQTAGGQVLDNLKLFEHGSPVTGAEAAQIWDAASKRFAEAASGEVSVFSTGAKRMNAWGNLRTWWRVELPALLNNPKITGIVRRRKDGTPCA